MQIFERKSAAPVAVLRATRNAAFEVRREGNLVAGANEQVFLASGPAQGQVSIALDRLMDFPEPLMRTVAE